MSAYFVFKTYQILQCYMPHNTIFIEFITGSLDSYNYLVKYNTIFFNL